MTATDWQAQIREATTVDVPQIVALYADDELGATRESPVEPLPASYWEAFEAILRDPCHRLVVIEQEGELLATLQLSFIPHLVRRGGERAQIEAVRVSASRRGSGLGHELIEWAVDQARRRGCNLVQLTTDATRADARRFYETLGFRTTHVGMKLLLDD